MNSFSLQFILIYSKISVLLGPLGGLQTVLTAGQRHFAKADFSMAKKVCENVEQTSGRSWQ